jgi:hypothetical protein
MISKITFSGCRVTVDPLTGARLLTYIGLLWQDLAAAGAIPAGGPLPPVLSIVLYNGAGPWQAATDLDHLLPPELPQGLRTWQPQLRYLLLDEQAPQDAALAESANLAAALFRLESSRTPADIQAVVGRLIEWLAAPAHDNLRRAFVVWLKRVLLPARAPGVELPPVNDLQEMHAMLAERVKTWTEEWKQQGITRGEAKLLRRQLVRRFGPLPDWVDARLDKAGEPELETWGERVLDSTSLEDVFAEPNSPDPAD